MMCQGGHKVPSAVSLTECSAWSPHHGPLPDSSVRAFCADPWQWGTWGLRALSQSSSSTWQLEWGRSQWEVEAEEEPAQHGGVLALAQRLSGSGQVLESLKPHMGQGLKVTITVSGTFWKFNDSSSTPSFTSFSGEDCPKHSK